MARTHTMLQFERPQSFWSYDEPYCNSRKDCVRESVKTSSDKEESNRSNEFEKSYLCISCFWEQSKFHFPKVIFLAIFQKIQQNLIMVPC